MRLGDCPVGMVYVNKWVEQFVYGGPRSHFFARNLLANTYVHFVRQNCFIQYMNFHHFIEKQKLI